MKKKNNNPYWKEVMDLIRKRGVRMLKRKIRNLRRLNEKLITKTELMDFMRNR